MTETKTTTPIKDKYDGTRAKVEDLADDIIEGIGNFKDYPDSKRDWLIMNLTTAYLRGAASNERNR